MGPPAILKMATDAAGEAVDQWFPDSEKVHFYAELTTPTGTSMVSQKSSTGVAIFKLKKRSPRKAFTGTVASTETLTGPSGFYVLWNHSKWREHHIDRVTTFSSSDENVRAGRLPDAHVLRYVNDASWGRRDDRPHPLMSAGDG